MAVINVDHVVGVEFKGPSTVGTRGMSHSVAHSALVGPCHFLFWLPEKILTMLVQIQITRKTLFSKSKINLPSKG